MEVDGAWIGADCGHYYSKFNYSQHSPGQHLETGDRLGPDLGGLQPDEEMGTLFWGVRQEPQCPRFTRPMLPFVSTFQTASVSRSAD